MNIELQELLKFAEFTNLFADIKRTTILNKDSTAENNSQHSFQLAMIAWFIADRENLNFDMEILIKYALVHDLVETYSGTFPAYDRNDHLQMVKEQREQTALNKIKNDFSQFRDLTAILDRYIKQLDSESKFIYSLDKLIPIINIELNNNDFYKKSQTTYEDMIAVKDQKISNDPTVYKYFKLLTEYLREDVKFFWPENAERDYSDKVYKFN